MSTIVCTFIGFAAVLAFAGVVFGLIRAAYRWPMFGKVLAGAVLIGALLLISWMWGALICAFLKW